MNAWLCLYCDFLTIFLSTSWRNPDLTEISETLLIAFNRARILSMNVQAFSHRPAQVEVHLRFFCGFFFFCYHKFSLILALDCKMTPKTFFFPTECIVDYLSTDSCYLKHTNILMKDCEPSEKVWTFARPWITLGSVESKHCLVNLGHQWEASAWDPNVKQRAPDHIGIFDSAVTKLAAIMDHAGKKIWNLWVSNRMRVCFILTLQRETHTTDANSFSLILWCACLQNGLKEILFQSQLRDAGS